MVSHIQSILLDRDIFTLKQAENWIKEHGFKLKKLDITVHYYRFRQLEPSMFKYLRMKRMGRGVMAVIGFI